MRSAVLSTTDVVVAGLLRLKPKPVHLPGNRVHLGPEIREVKAVDDIGGRQLDINGSTDWNFDFVPGHDVVLGIEFAIRSGVTRIPRPLVSVDFQPNGLWIGGDFLEVP